LNKQAILKISENAPRMRRTAQAALILLGIASSSGYCQIGPLGGFDVLSSNETGLHLYSLSLYSAYSSRGNTLGFALPSNSQQSEAATLVGSAVVGWSLRNEQTEMSVTYSPFYVQGVYFQTYHSFNQALRFNATRAFHTKWKISSSFSGSLIDFNQMLYSSGQAGTIAATPATFDQLAAGILTGKTTNVSLAQLLDSAPAVNSPEAAYLYGDRLLSLAGLLSISYSPSSRSTFTASIAAARSQNVQTGSNASESDSTVSLKTTNGTANLDWSYSLSPRTSLGVTLGSTRIFSYIQSSYDSTARMSLGRTLSRHWFVSGESGVGKITPVGGITVVNTKPQPIYGGTLGYKTHAHTFFASFTRGVGDVYGLGASATESGSAGWNWRPPTQGFFFSSTFGYSRLVGSAYVSGASWSSISSFGKPLGAHMAISSIFTYAKLPASTLSSLANLPETGVLLNLSWSPSARNLTGTQNDSRF
jgi:hypothetical protein